MICLDIQYTVQNYLPKRGGKSSCPFYRPTVSVKPCVRPEQSPHVAKLQRQRPCSIWQRVSLGCLMAGQHNPPLNQPIY